MMKRFFLIILFFNLSYAEYLDIQYASFSYTIGGSYGSCVKFKKSEYNFNDFDACSCAWAANTSNYSDCYELYYNPQTKMIKYNLSEGAAYIYRNFSSDYTCHIYNQEIQMNECPEMNEMECSSDNSCEWIDDIQSGWCGSFNNNSTACNNIDSCSYTTCQQACNWSGSAECESYPGCSYSYLTYSCSGTTTVPCCSGGSYQIDNSYCQEIEVLECSEMYQLACVNDDSCEWVEDIEYGNCSNYNNGTTCDANENCYWDLCYGGSYGSWSHCCRGGAFQVDNSYCEEVSYIPGDANGDGNLNVSDIVLIVDLILYSQYDEYSDINQDGILNIIDIVELVNLILSN